MSVERAPYKRPSLPGVLHDSHDRVQALEAAQMMPYQVGYAVINWPPNTTLSDIGGASDQALFPVFVDPDGFATLSVETTDETIFTCDNEGGCRFTGGGLFYYHASVQAVGTSLATATASASCVVSGGAYLTPGDYRGNAGIPTRIFALYPSFPLQNLQMGLYPDYYDNAEFIGWVSHVGFDNLSGDDAAPGPYSSSTLAWYLTKGAAGDEVTFICTWMVARWTPIGFGIWQAE